MPGRMTAQGLADRCAELGHPLDRSVIAKLEKGHRLTVTVADLVVLAKALDVPTPLLLYPLGAAETVEVLPGVFRATWDTVKWFTGSRAFPSVMSGERPTDPFCGTDEDNQAYATGSTSLLFHGQHDGRVTDWLWERGRVDVIEGALRKASTDEDRKAHQENLDNVQKRLVELERGLVEFRRQMRKSRIVPPSLPAVLVPMLGEPTFVVYERLDAKGQARARRTVAAGSEEDYHLAAASAWRPMLDVPFPGPPEDFDLDAQGSTESGED